MTAVTQVVPPAGGRHEGAVILSATIVVAAIVLIYARINGQVDEPEPLQVWQVSAFSTLTGADQAIYNSLYTVKDEIPYLYDDLNMFNQPGETFRWPNIEDFQDYLLPPFLKDTSWEQNGSLQWSLHEPLAEGEMQGSTMYLGTDGLLDQGSFLLVIGHVHAGFQNNNEIVVWWNQENHVEMPASGFRDGLILAGWKEVVPYSGRQEVERIFGE